MTNIEKALSYQPSLLGTLTREQIIQYQCPSDYFGLKDLCPGPARTHICPCEECWNQEIKE